MFLRTKEILGEVEGVRGPFGRETDAVLPRDIGKAVVRHPAAGEDDAFHLRADRPSAAPTLSPQSRKAGAPSVGDGLTCRGHQRLEPARTHVAAGIGALTSRIGPAGRGPQRGDCLTSV